MERIDLINPDRLRWCCEDRGITTAELAEAVGVSSNIMAKVMAGELGLTFKKLQDVAKFFGRGVLFFIGKGPVDEQAIHTPQFRTLANQKPGLSPEVKALIERAERQRQVFLDLREDMDADDLPRFRPPAAVDGRPPVEAAEVVRGWLKLGDQNDYATCRREIEAKGVLVLMAVGYFGDWRLPKEASVAGFSIYHVRCPIILVKKHSNEGRQLFTLAHELGHLVLHRSSFIDEEGDFYKRQGREREANVFAGHLLVPDVLLAKIDDSQRPDDAASLYEWLRPWVNRWGVSAEMILLRLLEAKRVTQDVYDAYRQWRAGIPLPDDDGGNRQYRHREPLHLFGERYVRTVLDSYHGNRISLNKASGFLDNLKIDDVHKLEEHVAGI